MALIVTFQQERQISGIHPDQSVVLEIEHY